LVEPAIPIVEIADDADALGVRGPDGEACAGDAVDKRVSVFAREPIANIKRDAWVEVTGKVEFGKRGEATVVRLVTPGPANVVVCNPDPNPYID